MKEVEKTTVITHKQFREWVLTIAIVLGCIIGVAAAWRVFQIALAS